VITLQWAYWLFGALLAWVALRSLRDRDNPRRGLTAMFWGLLSLSFLIGERLPATIMGAVVLTIAIIAGVGGVRLGRYPERSIEQRREDARRLGHRLFVPALLIPLLTLLLALPLKDLQVAGTTLLDGYQTTLIALSVACVIATVAACALTREGPRMAVEQTRRLLDAIGWAAILPLLLATLGSVFAAAGVGEAVAEVVRTVIPVESRIAVVLAYALGMAGFTMIMGNAFAAFPVMTAGIGLPLLVQMHGADAASLAATLVFAAAIAVTRAADFVGLEEKHLRDALVGVDLRRQRRGIRELQGDVAFPLRFQRRHVDDDAAARVRALAQAHHERGARDAEEFDRACQRERVRRNDAHLAADIDETGRIEGFRIDDGGIDIGEDLEFGRSARRSRSSKCRRKRCVRPTALCLT
jgi:uncharacterized membrane protein